MNAATYYFDPVHNEVGEGQEQEVAVLVNTNGERVNAFEGAVVFPDIVSVVNIETDDSIVDLWLDPPTVTGNRITFSGIVPGGFDGIRTAYGDERKSGVLLRIAYKGERVGSESFVFEDMKAYLHDGEASEAEIDIVPAVIDVSTSGVKREETKEEDAVKPELFETYIVQDEALAEGVYVVVFHTSDRGSGVAYYEVSESSTEKGRKWERASSPFVLREQNCTHDVYVKAIDHAGNERIVKAVCGEEGAGQTFSVLPNSLWYMVWVLIVTMGMLFVYIRRTRNS